MKRNFFWALFGPQFIILLACILSLAAYAWRGNRRAVSAGWLHVLESQASLAAARAATAACA